MKRSREEEGEVDMTNCLMLLSKVGENHINDPIFRERVLKGGAFKCKTCNRQFLSFQALGGHRASHKNLKLMGTHLSCRLPSPTMKSKSKMHLCPICGLGFSIGQALGGHMRKHRANRTKRFNLYLDLNLTPHENDLKLNLRTPVLDSFI